MEKDILIIKTQFQNRAPGSEPFQLGGANGLCFQLLWPVHLSNNQWTSNPVGSW